MKQTLAWLLAATLALPPATAQQDPLIDLLNNRNYDRDAVIRQFDHLRQTMTVSPPPAPDSDDDTDTATGEDAPQFRPLTPQLPPGVAARQPIETIALVLPTNAAGLTAAAADTFQQGCVDGLESIGAAVRVDTYGNDGSAAQAITAYQQAVDDGALFVIGPMQKNSVRALQQAYPQAPVNTLLLQPAAAADTDAAGDTENFYYVLTIDIGEEAAELARLISAQSSRVMIIADNTSLSQRQKRAFANAWTAAGGDTPMEFYIHDTARDWQRLFDNLKDLSEEEAAALEEAKERGATAEPKPPLALFAAGNGAFIRRARNFTPQGYTLYASSVFFSSADDAKFLDNLRIMEMPWFVAAAAAGEFARPQIHTRPALQQRFYALGADACRAAQQSLLWYDGWTMQGASGTLQLTDGTLRRRGILSQYQAGALTPLPQ